MNLYIDDDVIFFDIDQDVLYIFRIKFVNGLKMLFSVDNQIALPALCESVCPLAASENAHYS